MANHIIMYNKTLKPKEKKYTQFQVTILEAFLFFLIVVILGQLVSAIVSVPTFFFPQSSILFFPLSFFIGFGSVAFTLLKIKGMGLSDVPDFLHTHIKPMHIILALMLYGVSLPLAEYLSMLVPVEGYPILEDLYKFFMESMNIIFEQKVAAFIMVCLLAPLLEEFIFRGIILRGLLQKGINPWVSILLTGFLFGAAHMNPWQFMGAGFLGMIFGFVYWRTQSLWLVICLHFLNNLIAYVVTLANNNLEETVFEPNPLLIIGSCILTALMVGVFYQRSKNNEIQSLQASTDN